MTETEPAEYVIETAERQGESLLTGDLLLYIERYHDDERPGVSDELVDSYVERLEERGFFPRGPDGMLKQIDDNRTDSETWLGEDAFYTVGEDRISTYPPRWHEELGSDDDIRAFVAVLHEGIEAADEGTDSGGAGTGVPQQLLVDAATVIGDYERQDALDELQEWRDRDELVMDADQHPDGRVQLTD